MANKLLIVHGYSDGSSELNSLGNFFIEQGLYDPADVFYLDYSSMDDDATFEDFADKLDADHRERIGERVDVVCHSTGSLVVRSWLVLHAERTRRRSLDEDCPVDRMICFAPANFGSDLAGLGQSVLGKFHATFFNSNSHRGDFLESGRRVLQALEPASPFQWDLSVQYDLHGEYTYFSEKREPRKRCYPVVLAAGEAYGGVAAQLIKQRGFPGTDGTVRIAGTSLNTRHCSIDFRVGNTQIIWWPEHKFAQIPFAVFKGFNHGSLIDPATRGFDDTDGPGTLALEALRQIRDLQSYAGIAKRFERALEENYRGLPADRQGRYQQFFFRVRDDVDQLVEDYYIDFHVVSSSGEVDAALTFEFDCRFKPQFERHSTSGAHRVLMLDCREVAAFTAVLRAARAELRLEVTGASPLPDVRYQTSAFVVYDPRDGARPDLLRENSTTLVDIILNREQTDKLLVLRDRTLQPLALRPAAVPARPTGRAAILHAGRS